LKEEVTADLTETEREYPLRALAEIRQSARGLLGPLVDQV